ncbi:alpha/beta fold hydrolase [Cryobacterium sp. TMT1-21]|uniref:Alpha/beta fold hydrolase n=1 Tax=Cryobacterium shii TaxID=1259235 RepID=A0AAQ2HFT9_9MICO|nr:MULTISPECIES: alpha/beta fold hydrolase [Cryobacterium]TFC49556.1 alpha/beta fold hydrolase [Cryobacterium shii]TFC89462.1 alpha/beta fold hydrolase [Cryobacterium sp. TmT2-59]TFD08670.1 alpha/beta fold hydrolase [Cryobacterium sp. TMT1-21]TFD15546.1 alpha/beta fold hydrolase [Cryobacterium sp. TMT4-10]TFD15870.1 alpha/beta fold hydrolase [Cryobacterium sp. TMT2-23]
MPTYTDDFGVSITYFVWAVDRPRAVVQLAHGVGEHAQRYTELAARLNAAGYTVYADDHRGHGQTGVHQHGGDLSRLGRLGPGGLRATVAGVHQFSGIIRAAHPELPLVLLGHSWGSFMAQMIVNEHAADYDAVVLSGTAYRMPGYLDGGDLNRRHKKLGTTGVEWLSRDPLVAEAFLADPLTTNTPLAKLFGLRDAARLFGRPARQLPEDLPMLILVGGDDTVGGERSARMLVKAYSGRSGLRDIRLIVYPGARHEIFNETNRDEVVADLVGWLNERLPLPRGAGGVD